MSTNHARDDWADPRTDEALRRELDALAGLGATHSGLDDALGAVTSRVRRRRAVKKAGLGATTLAVAGGLVVGGASLLPEPPPDPVPAVTPTPTPSGTPDPTPSDTPSAEATGTAVSMITDGHQPSWLEGTELVCGMPAADLPTSWDGATLMTTGEPADGVLAEPGTEEMPAYARLDARIEPTDVPAGAVVIGPTLVWTQDGRVVDVGTNMTEDPHDLGSEPLDLVAEDGVGASCAPDGTVEGRTAYPHDLPAGSYEVRVVASVWTDDFATHDLLLTPAFATTIDDDGTVRAQVPDAGADDSDDASGATSDRGVEPADGASDPAADGGSQDCSATGIDVGAPDLSGLPGTVGATANEIFDAVLACDDTTLAEHAEADGTQTNFGGRSPAEFWGLPDAERYEDVYATFARLVTGTGWVEDTTADGTTYIWPRVASAEHHDDDAAWQQVIDTGLLDADLAADMRQNEGYLGWRLGIHEDGTWRYFIAGD